MSFKAALAANSLYKIGNVTVLFLTTAILSRAMGAEGYGALSLMILNVAFFNMLTSFGTDSGITYTTASNKKNIDIIVGITLLIVSIQVVLLLIIEVIHYAITKQFLLLKTTNQQTCWLVFLFLLSISLQEKYSALLNGSHLYTQCNRLIFLGNLFALFVFAFFFFSGQTANIQVYLSLYVLANALLALALIILSKQNLRFSISFRFTKETTRLFFSYSFLVFITNLIQFLAYRADLWIVAYFRNDAEVGWYALAVRLVQLLWILPVLFASIIFPKVSGANEAYNHNQIHSLLRMLNAANIVGALFLVVLIRPVLVLVFGLQYEQSAMAFQILLPGVILFCNATVLAAYFAGVNELKKNLWGSALCFASIVVFDFLLIPKTGYIGAAIASSIGYALTAFYFLWQYCSQQKISVALLFLPQKEDLDQVRSFGKKILWKNP